MPTVRLSKPLESKVVKRSADQVPESLIAPPIKCPTT